MSCGEQGSQPTWRETEGALHVVGTDKQHLQPTGTHLRATCTKPPAIATCSEQTPSSVSSGAQRGRCPALRYLLLHPSTCPQEPDMDPHWSVLISVICCCFPVAHVDMKYQLCAEGVPPRRSRDANTPRGVLLIAHSE